jgi:hypothetical protein
LAVKDGAVIAWGSNERGETTVPAAASSGVTAVSGGEYYSLALKDGGVIGWGSNDYGVLNIPSTVLSGVSAIASGSYHSLALKNGAVIAWGMNVAGSTNVPSAAQSGVVAMCAGYLHSLALKSDGSVVAWGWNNMGQCDVPVAAQSDIVAIAAGYDFSMALKSDGTLVMWGDNDYGWLNQPAAATPMVAVASVAYHTLGLRAATWATLDQSEVFAGDSATGTVHLPSAAGPGGVNVDLTSDNSSVHVPAYVFVPEGATTANFLVTTDIAFGAETKVQIRASINGSASVAPQFKLKGTQAVLTHNRISFVGGSTSAVTVKLAIPATVGSDLTFTLTSSDPAAVTVPATITIPAGKLNATVPVVHNLVSTTKTVTITANFGTATAATGSATVLPVSGAVLFDPIVIMGGEYSIGYVYLSSPLRGVNVFPLSSNYPGSVGLPATVRMNAGVQIAVFMVTTTATQVNKSVIVTANVGGKAIAGRLAVTAPAWVSSIKMGTTLNGNCKLTGSVVLMQPAGEGGETVNLSATNGISVPATVFIPEGKREASFVETAPDVATDTPATITATLPTGSVSLNVTIKALWVRDFALSPTTVRGGDNSTGTVTLNTPVAVDTVVTLLADDGRATVPATVTVHAGSATATFPISTLPITGPPSSVILRAKKNASMILKRIYLTP